MSNHLPQQLREQLKTVNEHFTPKPAGEGEQPAEPGQEPQTQAPAPAETHFNTPGQQQPATPPQEPPKPAEAAPPPPPPPAEPPKKDIDWEQRYRTLEGMFRQTTTNFNTLKLDLEELKKNPPVKPGPTLQPYQPTADELETWGKDTVDFIEKMVGNALSGFTARLAGLEQKLSKVDLDEINTRVSNIQQTVTKTVVNDFIAELQKIVPDALDVDARQEWRVWLGSIEPMSGLSYQRLLDKAKEDGSAPRAAKVFEAYKAQSGQTSPAPAPAPAPAPQPAAPATNPSLAAFAAPGQGRPTPAPATQDTPKTYTQQDLLDAQAAKRNGRMTNEGWDAFYADFLKAASEGRVTA